MTRAFSPWVALAVAGAALGADACATREPAGAADTPWSRFAWRLEHAHTAFAGVYSGPARANVPMRLALDFDHDRAVYESPGRRYSYRAGELVRGMQSEGTPLVSEPWDAWEPMARQVWSELEAGLPGTKLIVEWPAQVSAGHIGGPDWTRRLDFDGTWDDALRVYLSVDRDGTPFNVTVLTATHETAFKAHLTWYWDVPLAPDLWQPEPRTDDHFGTLPEERIHDGDALDFGPEASVDHWAWFEHATRYVLPLDASASDGWIDGRGNEHASARLESTCAAGSTGENRPFALVYAPDPASESHARAEAALAAGCPVALRLVTRARQTTPTGARTRVSGTWTVLSSGTTPPTILGTLPYFREVTAPSVPADDEGTQTWAIPPGTDLDRLQVRFDGELEVRCAARGSDPVEVDYGASDDRPTVLTWPGCHPEYGVVP